MATAVHDTLFLVRFTDHPERLDVRTAHLSAHLDWLRANAGHVLLGGVLRPAADAPPAGSAWLVRADSREAVDRLIASDPFWVHGLRKTVDILVWSKALPDVTAIV